jgi:beta-1,4-mannosyl-glycoprotein beta-1,4-N-acetylglucosaminyltransferase
MKRFDIFSLNNEIKMLELRLNILNDYVDFFVIAEANETFSGFKKDFNFEKNLNLFEKFKNKIIYYKIMDTPNSPYDSNCNQEILYLARSSDNVTPDNICWLKEFYQKECIKLALQNIATDEDICYVSDIDEVWDYKKEVYLENEIYKFNIDYCYFEFLNMRSDEDWRFFTGPILTKYKNIKHNCLNHLRTYRKMKDKYKYIRNGGWHFNALGGVNKKIDDFAHPYYTEKIMNSRRTGLYVEFANLPDYVQEHLELYEELIYNDTQKAYQYSLFKKYSKYFRIDYYKKLIYPYIPDIKLKNDA